MSEITKKSIEHLAELAKLELTDHEKEKFSGELKKILDHFDELQAVNTDNILPMTGGTELKNVLREDAPFTENHFADAERIHREFPDKERGFLKVPPVFE